MGILSSGKQLLLLLRDRCDEIISRETTNSDRIFIYDTGGRWTAFEKSAYQLAQLCTGCEVMPIILNGYPFPIAIASVPHHALSGVLHGGNGEISIQAKRSISPRSYQTWHNRLGKRLNDCVISDKESSIEV